MEQIRSFVAIELPLELRQELVKLEDQLKSGVQTGARWVDPYNIHLTLKFLGNIPVSRAMKITRVMQEAAREVPPFHLQVRELGVFPNLKRVQVVWVGIKGEIESLGKLQQRLESGLAHLGFAPESRQFTPHLTLARLRNQTTPEERRRLGQIIATTTFEATNSINVEAISLMKSHLTREGAIYSRIGSVDLGKPLSTASS